MIDFCVLGSGISGSTIANLLDKKFNVLLIDKARGIGGRASNKTYKSNISFDHGLQYFSSKEKKFNKLINQLHKNKILKIWEGPHLDLSLKNKKTHKICLQFYSLGRSSIRSKIKSINLVNQETFIKK